MMQSRVIGLTGGSGSGKSTVAGVFAEFGATVIDADKISHDITDSDETALSKIRDYFGDEVFDNGILNRKKLGKIVFKNKTALEKLNSIIHPAVAEKIAVMVKNSDSSIIVIDAPLLLAVKEIVQMCHEIVGVCAPDEMRINRITARDGISREDAVLRLDSQISQEEIKKKANYVIINDGDMEKLRSEVVGYLGK